MLGECLGVLGGSLTLVTLWRLSVDSLETLETLLRLSCDSLVTLGTLSGTLRNTCAAETDRETTFALPEQT